MPPPYRHKSRSRDARKLKKENQKDELKSLNDRITNFEPDRSLKKFADLPLSEATLTGLKNAHFLELTDIQKVSLSVSLKGKDVLGAAKTGSGKTLAFLIPLLEVLHRQQWTQLDGLGALVISPTRELAIQIFEVLRKIGSGHPFSAGLVIGGKNLKDEKERLDRMNILIATPGRLLQHMDQTAGFNCDQLQMLILDEADRILDLGFSKEVNAIIEHLPKLRQTLLFSATQTKSVSDLARLSLKNPEYISVDEIATPASLQQHYLVSELPEKLDVLFSFIKTHLKVKTIAFFSSCKQVRFVYETFRRLSPGIPLLHLHGKQKQSLRMEITEKYSKMKHAFLFATDIAARGLDFPAVDWVVQVDAPENVDTYIHRVGRTARLDRPGRALAFFLPSEEEGMLAQLEKKQVPIKKIDVRNDKKQSVQQALQGLCFKDPEIKYLGQKAFVSYMRSVHLQSNKQIFNVDKLPAKEFAEALGLPGTPKIKFAKKQKNSSRQLEAIVKSTLEIPTKETNSNEEEKEELIDNTKKVRTKIDKIFERKNQGVLAEHYDKLVEKTDDEDDEGDFITLKRRDHELDENIPKFSDLSKRKLTIATSKAKSLKSNKVTNDKLIFDDEGNPHAIYELENEKEFLAGADAQELKKEFLEKEYDRMQEIDKDDKVAAKEKKREKKRARKERERKDEINDERQGVVLINEKEEVNSRAENDFESENESEEEILPPIKKQKTGVKVLNVSQPTTLEDQEALARQLLGIS